jgi:hypothetical protein
VLTQKHRWNKAAAIELEKRRPGFSPPHFAWLVDANCANPRASETARRVRFCVTDS